MPALLGCEFLWAARVNRRDAEAPGWRAIARAWWAECRLAIRVFGWLQPFRAHAWPDRLAPTPGRRGVVLVHGFCCNRALWAPWLRELHRQGRCYVALNLQPPWGPVERHVPALDAAVRQVRATTGVPPLLVCHSMGGLVAQAWLCTQADAPDAVHAVVTFGTPFGGTGLAAADLLGIARQMRPGRAGSQAPGSGLSAACRLRFTCWYSLCDNIVFPAARACLPGARHRSAHRLAHVELVFDAELRRQTLGMLDEPSCAGAPTGDEEKSPRVRTDTWPACTQT
ncbi:triacylglycerol lipase [Xenophilus sp. Marseille-Q4582]|uniref:esterase/lipase family protein n=1 Tax=Xenophilus sp. Marseille-Q4582 TaxID=2866600 RepID=UPI001CE3EB03|nr:alpha/beta fold hydrolase [Xenophilus sp. Marseille-Q4582]